LEYSTLFVYFSVIAGNANSQPKSAKNMISIPVEVIVDKIRGGVLGQMIGNMNGWPYETSHESCLSQRRVPYGK